MPGPPTTFPCWANQVSSYYFVHFGRPRFGCQPVKMPKAARLNLKNKHSNGTSDKVALFDGLHFTESQSHPMGSTSGSFSHPPHRLTLKAEMQFHYMCSFSTWKATSTAFSIPFEFEKSPLIWMVSPRSRLRLCSCYCCFFIKSCRKIL